MFSTLEIRFGKLSFLSYIGYYLIPYIEYDHEFVEKLKVPEGNQLQKVSAGTGALGGLIGVFLASLIRPLANMFRIPSTSLINLIIIIIVVMITLSVFVYVNRTRVTAKLE